MTAMLDVWAQVLGCFVVTRATPAVKWCGSWARAAFRGCGWWWWRCPSSTMSSHRWCPSFGSSTSLCSQCTVGWTPVAQSSLSSRLQRMKATVQLTTLESCHLRLVHTYHLANKTSMITDNLRIQEELPLLALCGPPQIPPLSRKEPPGNAPISVTNT